MAVKGNVWHWWGMAREDLHFRLRIPEDLKKTIEAWADVNNRSMTAEIISRLEQSISEDASRRIAEAEVEKLRGDLAYQHGVNAAVKQGYALAISFLRKAEAGEPVSIDAFAKALNELEPPKRGD